MIKGKEENIFLNIVNIVKKVDGLRVERSRRRGRLKKKWLWVIGEDVRACGVD